MKIDNWYVNPELSGEEVERRTHAAEEWTAGLYEIIERTQDIEAQRLLDGVLGGVAVGLPDPQRYLVPVQGPEWLTIMLIPLFSSDRDISDTTRALTGPNPSQIAR